MSSNALAAAIEQSDRRGDRERLSPRTAALCVTALSLLSWAIVLVPVIALIHR